MYQYHYQRPTPHLLFDIAQGKMYDSAAVNIFGFNREIGTAFETIWNDGGTYVYPSSALAMTIVSSSASDTMQVLVKRHWLGGYSNCLVPNQLSNYIVWVKCRKYHYSKRGCYLRLH